MTDGTPYVAAMVEESERYVCCDNEHFYDVRKCDHTRALQSNVRRPREREDMWNCVPGPRQVHCN